MIYARTFQVKSLLLCCTAVFLLPLVVSASMVVRTGDMVSIAAEETIEGDFYAAGETISVSGGVAGDALLAGGTVTINGSVGEDLFTIGGVAQVHSNVGDDVRVIAGETTIAERVAGDVMVMGGVLRILSTATIEGDVLFYGGELFVEGPVTGSVYGSHELTRIDAPVGGSVDVTANRVTLGDRAAVEGNVRYTSNDQIERASQAIVVGDIVRNDAPTVTTDPRSAGRFLLLMLLVSLFSTLSLYLLARRQVESIVMITQSRTLLAPAIGLATMLFGPFVIAVLLFSVLGSMIGFLVLFLAIILTILALILANAVFGGWLIRFIKPGQKLTVQWVFVGGIALHAIVLIPIVGFLVYVYVFMMSLGALVLRLYATLR